MHARNELERLAAAGRPLVSVAESLVDPGEEDRILEWIVATNRVSVAAAARPRKMRARAGLLIAAVAIVTAAAAVASTGVVGQRARPRPAEARQRRVDLTGATISLAGYRFRTPVGFKRSDACQPATSTPGSPNTVIHSMRAAASADGGCIGVAILARNWAVPSDAQAVSVGSYNGFLVPGDPQEALFVQIPVAEGDHYLVVTAQRLTAQQLIAIAESGLPGSQGQTQTCTVNCN